MRVPMVTALFAAILAATTTSAQSPDWNQAAPLTVEMSNFKFAPSTLSLKHGVPYRIHFSNTSRGGHNFVAKDFFADSTIAAADRDKVENGGIGLGGGESVDVRLVANRPGSYKSHCSHFMHTVFGMTGRIVVQ